MWFRPQKQHPLPEGREGVTGYRYEPWHIRYMDDPETAREIMKMKITLEEYSMQSIRQS